MARYARSFVLAATLAVTLPVAVPAIAQMTTKAVTFPKGSTGTQVSGTLKGDQIVDYVVNAKAGQTMRVTKSGSAIVYFNVMPPGSQGEAIYTGSTRGDSYTGTLPANGAYKIRVYQMRATARRNETGSYKLAISVTGSGSPSANRPGNAASGSSGKGSIAGINGMDAISAIDLLRERGFDNVDSFSSGDTLYGIYYYRPGKLCVQTTSANSKIVDIRDIKTHPKCK